MPIKLSEILFHIDWEASHGEIRMRYEKPVDSPYDLASLSETIPPPEHLESDDVQQTPFFSRTGAFKVIPELGKSGLYLLRLRPHYRLKNLIVDPDEIVVDVYANRDDSITYSFYNPTRRSSFVVSGQLMEDFDGFFRKITSYPDDPVWRQSIVKRSMASYDESGGEGEIGHYPAYMTAEQIADYLQVEVKTIRKWTSEGRIPHSKLGSVVRFRKDEIDAAIKAGTFRVKQVKASKKK
jgi:excisionase family DNA binding protein